MNSSKNTEKEIQKNLLEFIRMMDGMGPVGLSNLTHVTNNDRDLAIFYLKPMVKKKWITSITGHIENSYKMTKKGIVYANDWICAAGFDRPDCSRRGEIRLPKNKAAD